MALVFVDIPIDDEVKAVWLRFTCIGLGKWEEVTKGPGTA